MLPGSSRIQESVVKGEGEKPCSGTISETSAHIAILSERIANFAAMILFFERSSCQTTAPLSVNDRHEAITLRTPVNECYGDASPTVGRACRMMTMMRKAKARTVRPYGASSSKYRVDCRNQALSLIEGF